MPTVFLQGPTVTLWRLETGSLLTIDIDYFPAPISELRLLKAQMQRDYPDYVIVVVREN